MHQGRFLALAALVALCLGLQPSSSLGGDKVTLGERVAPGERTSFDEIDHSAWGNLLRRYADRQGLVDYKGWKANSADRLALGKYLASLSHADPATRSSRESRLAYWINAYNAVTVEGILREYPTSSIRNHTARLVGYNIWDDLLLVVGDRSYSLSQIEHEILRKLGEPRIHFAIVCASLGCPPLRDEAYWADRIEEQLADNSRRFFADPAKFLSDAQRREISISPILKWFAEDFGPDSAAQMRAIAPYLPDESSRQLAHSGRASVRYLDYDWDLNDRTKRASTARRSGR